MEPDHTSALGVLQDRERILVFTGAGISTESGIPDFRGPSGIWKTVDPADYTYDRYLRDPAFRAESWGRRFDSPLLTAVPNAAHEAVTRLWRSGRSHGCVTQNIDGLHVDAGMDPSAVIELHGNAGSIHCINCSAEPSFSGVRQRWKDGDPDPACRECGGILKTQVVYFGEDMPQRAMAAAWRLVDDADAVLVIGSTLSVYPAAFVPLDVVDHGHPMVIVNQGPTEHDRRASSTVDGAAGVVVPAIVDGLTEAGVR